MVVEKCEAKWLPKATLVPAQQVWPKIETNLYNLFIILMELILPVNDWFGSPQLARRHCVYGFQDKFCVCQIGDRPAYIF